MSKCLILNIYVKCMYIVKSGILGITVTCNAWRGFFQKFILRKQCKVPQKKLDRPAGIDPEVWAPDRRHMPKGKKYFF